MNGLLIANEDRTSRDQIADKFKDTDYRINTVDSVVNALEGIIDKTIQVVLLSGTLDEQHIAKFVPLLKKCNRNLSIILISDEIPLDLLRIIRKEGIFYHALKPAANEGWEEIRQVVKCAFEKYHERQNTSPARFRNKLSLQGAKTLLTSLAMILVFAQHVMATDTDKIYNSGILVLLFVGFCALLIVVQLIPALLNLFGMTKETARTTSRKMQLKVTKNN